MTLTLPGIAGIILTIGMAVDANVLIFERIREEAQHGRTPANALQAGYERALAAILDANITTFIAAAVLFMLGAGPVRGFAVTLGIGIVTSVFTAFVFSRLLAVLWLRGFKPKQLPI
jgi:protein-export membrane protein SecD